MAGHEACPSQNLPVENSSSILNLELISILFTLLKTHESRKETKPTLLRSFLTASSSTAMNAKEPQEILGVPLNAGLAEVRQAYRQLALKWHPDKHIHGKDKEIAIDMFAKITNAYQVLIEDLNRPSKAGKSKIQTRIPTPVPSFGSSRLTPTSPTSSSVSQLLTPYSRDDLFHALPGITNQNAKIKDFDSIRDAEQNFAYPDYRNRVALRETEDFTTPDHKQRPNSRSPPRHQATPPPYSAPIRPDRPYDGIHSFHGESKRPSLHRNARDPMVVRHLSIGDNSQLFTPGPPLQSIGLGPSGEWAYRLTLTLEELFSGKRCRFCVIRNYLSGRSKNVILEVEVPSGSQNGTGILCREAGHELAPRNFQDVTFVIEETPHPRFTRIRDDLFLSIRLPWADVYSHPLKMIAIVGIDGQEMEVIVDCNWGKVLKGELSIRGAGMV